LDLSLRPAAVNCQPALAVYTAGGFPFALKVVTVDGDRISGITGFVTPRLFPAFGLPERLVSAGLPGSV
jgi:RNA polymerase sigma-70 factor (ECF subfamily)